MGVPSTYDWKETKFQANIMIALGCFKVRRGNPLFRISLHSVTTVTLKTLL